MLPRGPLGKKQLGNLRVYKGPDHPHAAQSPTVLDVAKLNPKNSGALNSMAETLSSLADLKGSELAPASAEAPVHVQKLDKLGRAYATGKRKNAVARVWIKPGRGLATVNGKPLDQYFARPVLRMILSQPLVVVNRITQYDLTVTVTGGGLSGQAGAVRHGLAKALTYFEPDLGPRSRRKAFSPAIRAWSSARSTATARRARASSSPSAERDRRGHAGPTKDRVVKELAGEARILAGDRRRAARGRGSGRHVEVELSGRRASQRRARLRPRTRPNADGFYEITEISGEANGVAITGLQPPGTAIPGNDGYPVDNLVRTEAPQLSMHGFGYALADGTFANPFYGAHFAKPDYLRVLLRSSEPAVTSEPPVAFTATLAP